MLGVGIAAMFLSLGCAVLSWFYMPPGFTDGHGNWFSRSGALLTIFPLLALAIRDDVEIRLFPGGMGDATLLKVRDSIRCQSTFVQRTALVLTVLGTFIWGYGDVIFAMVRGS